VVYLSYEMAAAIEPGLRLPAQPGGSLIATALRVPAALLYDHGRQRCYAMAEQGEPQLLERLVTRALGSMGWPQTRPEADDAPEISARVVEDDPERFASAIRRAQEYIHAGDIYQVNLSRQWQVTLGQPVAGHTLYSALRRANPAPFAAWAQFPDLHIYSSSPERLVRVAGRRVETRPIAGTRARFDAGNARLELAELLASPKERAEHVMLIDLERNDLGKVCEAGTVQVDEFMVTESYQHVHHIVSNVRGELRAATNPVEVLRAVFPGGTITGCPKYRCMQIIAELEGVARGAYTGSLGYINRDGSMDFNILIRSLTLAGAMLEFRAGAGIVADSDWQHELAETRAKALGLLRALGAAQ
jgi:anthranilate synthase component 1